MRKTMREREAPRLCWLAGSNEGFKETSCGKLLFPPAPPPRCYWNSYILGRLTLTRWIEMQKLWPLLLGFSSVVSHSPPLIQFPEERWKALAPYILPCQWRRQRKDGIPALINLACVDCSNSSIPTISPTLELITCPSVPYGVCLFFSTCQLNRGTGSVKWPFWKCYPPPPSNFSFS